MNEERPVPSGAEPPAAPRPESEQRTAESPSAQPVSGAPPSASNTASERASKRRMPSAPKWLPLALLAIVPALIVGLVVYFVAGQDGGSDNSAGVLEGFFAGDGQTTSYQGEKPPEFPGEFPIYKGSEVIASFETVNEQGTSLLVILRTGGSVDDVYKFYTDQLDNAPWQIEVARSSAEFTGLRFVRSDNPDIEGQVAIHRSTLDNRTSIYVTYQDVAATSSLDDETFELAASRPLPPGFPSDIPIYKGRNFESVVLETQYGRQSGNNVFLVSFLTKDSQDDVIRFYRQDFEKRGWTVTDSPRGNTGFTLSIDFSDGVRQEISGTIQADAFQEDADYVRVDMQLQVSARRGRGN